MAELRSADLEGFAPTGARPFWIDKWRVPLSGAASFLAGQKGGKKPLRTYGSKDSLLPAGLRRSDSGAWGSRGLPFPSRALRPAAVELSTFLSQRTAPAAVGVGGFVFLRLLR